MGRAPISATANPRKTFRSAKDATHECSPRLRSHPSRRSCHLPGLRHRRCDGRCHRRREDRSRRQGYPPVNVAAGHRCPRQTGPAGDDRHPRSRLSLRQRTFRHGRRHGWRAFRRHHGDRPGRSVMHDAAGLPPLRRRAGGHPGRSSPRSGARRRGSSGCPSSAGARRVENPRRRTRRRTP